MTNSVRARLTLLRRGERASRRPPRLVVLSALTLLSVLVSLAVSAPAALADHDQVSSFQDDNNLVYCSTAVMERTLRKLEGLGVERIRINLVWAAIAPDPNSRKKPKHFNAADPADYGAASWYEYDRLIEAAPLYGMHVQINVTAPAPLWATAKHPFYSDQANHWYPNAKDYGEFVHALGVRYSGSYDGLPRVTLWSLWNEPNQRGWLSPQWRIVDGHRVPNAPRLYRSLLRYGWDALVATGHRHDEILIGETAPEGVDNGHDVLSSMTPIPFLRALYCVNDDGVPLRGGSAAVLGCPTSGKRSAFVTSNPGLFDASGWAHHPYNFFHSPSTSLADPNDAPLADISRLGRALSGVFHTYGVHRQLPIYITEYGYQTNPPDPHQIVTPNEQAVYLNESDYMAWKDTRIRSVAQFLLYDSAPNHAYKPGQEGYWGTFQTGLLYQRGEIKPAYYAYRMPIFIPETTFRRGTRTFIWGQARPADQLPSQTVSIIWRPAGGSSFRTIAHARTGEQGYISTRVRLPGSGTVKIGWTHDGVAEHSRGVAVTES